MTPEYLSFYKFRAISEWLYSSLDNSSIYAASPGQLNDKLDCQLDLEAEFEKSSCPGLKGKAGELMGSASRMNFIENWRRELQDVGVFSFCKHRESNARNGPMWAHYADGHKGVCLEYSIDKDYIVENWLGVGKRYPIIACRDVVYKDSLGFSCLKSGFESYEEFVSELLVEFLTTKERAWAYEDEGRVVFRKSGEVKIPRSALRRIIFGVDTPDDDVVAVMARAGKYSPPCDVLQGCQGR